MESPKTLTREETTKFLDHLKKPSPLSGPSQADLRNYAMAIFILESGLRANELSLLQLQDVLFANQPVRTLVVRPAIAKLGIERRIPVSIPLDSCILALRHTLWRHHADQPQTFCWYRSTPNVPLTTRSIEAAFRKAGLASINRPVYPHLLRHTFATNMMRVTSARIVQELLGHADLRSTMIYTHPNGDDLTAAIAAKDAQTRSSTP
jgi:integrase